MIPFLPSDIRNSRETWDEKTKIYPHRYGKVSTDYSESQLSLIKTRLLLAKPRPLNH